VCFLTGVVCVEMPGWLHTDSWGAVTQKVGTGRILGTGFWVLGSLVLDLSSGSGGLRKRGLRMTGLNHTTYHHVDGYDPVRKTMKEYKMYMDDDDLCYEHWLDILSSTKQNQTVLSGYTASNITTTLCLVLRLQWHSQL